MASTEKLAFLRRSILGWYRANSRPFPWRVTRDPYRILVSEIMLQQTQADRVAILYPKFLTKYPTVERLGRAPRSDVVRAWKGLGYNNRAVRLHDAVKEIRASYGGRVPDSIDDLDALPGIGKYTSHAVACFAYGRKTPLVDVNVRRVLSRIFRRMKSPADVLDERAVWELAARVLPRDAYSWNQALMELGARVCVARVPRCGACPVRAACASSRSLGRPGRAAASGKPLAGAAAARTNAAQKIPEPTHFGVPRRIWRGRIVEHLRGAGRPVTLESLDGAVRPGARRGGAGWLEPILGRLEKDGLVKISRSGGRVTVGLAA